MHDCNFLARPSFCVVMRWAKHDSLFSKDKESSHKRKEIVVKCRHTICILWNNEFNQSNLDLPVYICHGWPIAGDVRLRWRCIIIIEYLWFYYICIYVHCCCGMESKLAYIIPHSIVLYKYYENNIEADSKDYENPVQCD